MEGGVVEGLRESRSYCHIIDPCLKQLSRERSFSKRTDLIR